MLIILVGHPGSGKTTMAASMTKLGYHVHYIDMDQKIGSSQNLQPLIEQKKISYIQCPHRLATRKLKSMALEGLKAYPKIQPKGYIWFSDLLDEYAAGNHELKAKETVICIDSFTAVNRHLKNMLRWFAKSPKLGFDGWDSVLQNYEALFDCLKNDLIREQGFPHIIVNCHSKDDFNELEQRTEYRPLIDGQFRDQAASWAEEVYFLQVKAMGQKADFIAFTKPVGGIKHARTSFNVNVKVVQDFKTIWEGKK